MPSKKKISIPLCDVHAPKSGLHVFTKSNDKKSKDLIVSPNVGLCDHSTTIRKMGKYLSGIIESEKKNTYFDVKTSITVPSATVTKAVEMLRREGRSLFGNNILKITLPYDLVPIPSAVTSGVVNAVRNVDCSLAPEFASVNLLFDEFRYQKKLATFHGDCVGYGSGDSGNGALIQNSIFAMAYDPADNTALTSVNSACQLKQHFLLPRYVGSAGYGAVGSWNCPSRDWMAEEGSGPVNNNAGALTVVAPRQWQASVIASALPVGFWKFYWVISSAVVTSVYAPVTMFHLEFRCRK